MAEIVRLVGEQIPPLLFEIPEPPSELYLRGSLPPLQHKILAVVGSRRMSSYGKDACEHIIRGLSGYPISIVSGLALGIDGVAHKTALKAGLHTVAVPGSGIDDSVIYPRSHLSLAKEILKSGGALLSEEEPLFHARPESFPKRNRIMAGMSHATLVVEASEKSGTMITARLTLDYNRELLCVPHSIFAESGAGGHLYMKLGATPIRSAEDILEIFNIEENKTQNLDTLTTEEHTVINFLKEPQERDELIRRLGMPTSQANVLLLDMELKGYIKETMGKIRANI